MDTRTFTHKLASLLNKIDNRVARSALEKRALLHVMQGDDLHSILKIIRDSSIYTSAHV